MVQKRSNTVVDPSWAMAITANGSAFLPFTSMPGEPIGIPGTAGFISKWLLITAALESGPWGWTLVAVILVSSLMAVVYIWRIVEALYFQAPVESDTPVSEAPLQLLLVTWGVALLNVVFGLFPAIPLALANASASLLTGGAP